MDILRLRYFQIVLQKNITMYIRLSIDCIEYLLSFTLWQNYRKYIWLFNFIINEMCLFICLLTVYSSFVNSLAFIRILFIHVTNVSSLVFFLQWWRIKTQKISTWMVGDRYKTEAGEEKGSMLTAIVFCGGKSRADYF